jgi:excisionase family DNA binding protein
MELQMSNDSGALAYSIPDAAKRIGISRSGLYLLIKLGELPTAKIGSRRLILDADLRAYLNRHRDDRSGSAE